MTNSLRPVTTQWKFSILSVCNTDLVPPLLNLRERGREGGRERGREGGRKREGGGEKGGEKGGERKRKEERGKRRNRGKEIKENERNK